MKLTMAQALVRAMAAQRVELEGKEERVFGGVFAIFGHGNVAGLGEALAGVKEDLPTLRGQNEQSMAHAAIAYAKAHARRRMMACTTSIGPGATNLVTAAATAHVNRLPLLLLPGDVFASRAPDPVLQQIEHPGEPWVTANDTLRPVSRFWDRITRPEQLISSFAEAMRVLHDPAECGPVTLALPQDVQTEAFDYPASMFEPKLWRRRRQRPDAHEVERAAAMIMRAERPLIIAGGGVHYALASLRLGELAALRKIPVAETQAGKGALPWDHPWNAGAIGVTGSAAANALARHADLVICMGTRLADFTTASRTLFEDPAVRFIGVNVGAFDAHKHGACPLVGDLYEAIEALDHRLGAWSAPEAWSGRVAVEVRSWNAVVEKATQPPPPDVLPTDAAVLGAVNRASQPEDVVVCAAGGLPGELHKLWRTRRPGGYHLEYGYSCMGYEIAGGLGVKLATGKRGEVFVMVGDGSYLMMCSEIVTAVAMKQRLIIVLLDNRGYGCIHRLQQASGGAPFNNLRGPPEVDFVAHAASMGARAERVAGIAALEEALGRARKSEDTWVLVIDTDPHRGTAEGGAWWDVAVPEVSDRGAVGEARQRYLAGKSRQRA